MAVETYAAVSRIGTEAAGINPVQIAANVQETFARELPWMTGQLCALDAFTGPGTRWQDAMAPGLTMSSTSESATTGNGDKSVAFTLTSRTMDAVLYAVDVVWTKQAIEATQGDIQALTQRAGARAAMNIVDSTMCALYTEAPSSAPDHEIGVAGTPYDYAMYLAALELLNAQNAPGPYTQVFNSNQLSEALSIPEFIEAQIFGRGTIEQGINVQSGLIGYSTQNCRFYVSNNAVTSSGNRGFMFSHEGLGLRIKQNFKAAVDASRLDISPRVLIIGFEIWFAAGGTRNTSTTNTFVVETLT